MNLSPYEKYVRVGLTPEDVDLIESARETYRNMQGVSITMQRILREGAIRQAHEIIRAAKRDSKKGI